jgi:hypothetical protein
MFYDVNDANGTMNLCPDGSEPFPMRFQLLLGIGGHPHIVGAVF